MNATDRARNLVHVRFCMAILDRHPTPEQVAAAAAFLARPVHNTQSQLPLSATPLC